MAESDVKQVALQMARALKEVHSQGITHRDVKPENILLREQGDGSDVRVGLTDFGFATPDAPIGAQCTLAYAAPEIIQYLLDTHMRQTESAPYTYACDCWSLGGASPPMLPAQSLIPPPPLSVYLSLRSGYIHRACCAQV
jgi:serine/threonine protein kinase